MFSLLAATICAGCSQSTTTTTSNTTTSTSSVTAGVDATQICKYIEETIGWDKLSQKDKDTYTSLYNHDLPAADRQAWYADIVRRMALGTTSSSKLVLRAPGSMSVAAPKVAAVSAADAKAYAKAADHIKQVWTKKMPVSKLSKEELAWYNAILKKQLPAEQQHKWDQFLSPSKSQSKGKTMSFGVAGMH